MKFDRESLVQRDLNYAIVDEVDSILIDEARTPLIISGSCGKIDPTLLSGQRYHPFTSKRNSLYH